jgi:protein ImuB
MFAVLHLADFPLHAVLRTERGAAGKPAALFSSTSKKSVVLAANPAARSHGVELGMTAPQAMARCPALLIRSPHPDAEAEARASLLAIGFTLSPSIEDTAPGICTADVHGLDPAKLKVATHSAVRELHALGLPVTAGLARTPLLALYAARSAANRSRSSFSFSLDSCVTPAFTVAEERTKNDYANEERENPEILLVADEKSFLAPLPLSAADPSPELASIFHAWGLRTLGDLIALPRDEIVRRFGAAGLAFWNRANGGAPRPLHPVTPPQTFAAAMELENEIETLEPLLFLLRRFLDRLTLELRASQHVAAELHLTLKLEDDTQHTRSFRLPEPTADVEILFRTLHTHLESLSTAASIIALELRLTPARPLVRQQGLFETGLRDPHGFAETLARVSALVGSDRVGTPQLEDTHRPDAVKLIAPLAVVPPSAAAPLHPPLGLSLRRFRPPIPVRFGTDDQRSYIWSDTVRGEIAAKNGPYSKSGDWWQSDRAWARREWDIALADHGGLYRLIQTGEGYFLEGEYD